MAHSPIDTEILGLARTRRGPYLAALGAARSTRAALLAVLAFDAELAGVCAKVSEPMLGRIRLQWWLDALPGVTGGRPPGHPVAQALAPLGLKLGDLRALVETFNFDLDEGSADVAEHLAQAQARGGALGALLGDVLGLADAATRAAVADVLAAWTLAEAVAGGARIADAADAQALAQAARAGLARARGRAIDRARGRILDRARIKAAMPILALARLTEMRLAAPAAPLGAGAVLRVWWAGLTGRY